MITTTTTYREKWDIEGHPNYAVSPRGDVINKKSCKVLNRIVKGYSVGYCLDGKFITLAQLRGKLRYTLRIDMPF